jgi:O-antigen ligase
MNKIRNLWENHKSSVIIILLIVIVQGVLLYNDAVLTSITVFSVLGIALLLSLLIKKEIFYFATIFFIPLSFPMGEGIGPSISFPSELFAVILFLNLFFTFFVIKKFDFSILKHPITLLIMADIIWLLITSLLGTMPIVSLKRTGIKILYVSIYYFYSVGIFRNTKNIKKAFFFYILGFIFPIISAFIFHTKYDFSIAAAYVMTKPFYNDHTIYGACLAFVIPIIFYFLLESKKTQKVMWIMLLIVFFGAVFLSFSRAAWLSLVLILLLYIATFFKVNMKFIVLSCMALVVAGFFSFNTFKAKSKQNKAVSNKDVVQQVESMSNISSDASNTERLNRWYCAWQMFLDKPIAGFGPGTYQFKYGPYQIKSMMTRISTYKGDRGNAHSDYLGYLSETGIVGLFIYLSLVFSTMQLGLENIYHLNNEQRKLSMALFLAVCTFFIAGLFNSFIDIDKSMMLVLCAIAALVAIDLKNKAELHSKI